VSCIPSHGPYARVCTRSGYVDLQTAVDSKGWFAKITLSDSTVRELTLFLKVLGPHNGFPILHQLTDIRVDMVLSNPVCKKSVIPQARGGYDAVVVSDASDFKVSCKWLEGNLDNALSFTLTDAERKTSSGERELLALLKAFRHFHHVLNLKMSIYCGPLIQKT